MKKVLLTIVVIVLAFAATAQMSTNRPVRLRPLPPGVKAERNIPYVENGSPSQVLDLFLPEQPSDHPLPLMIWIHGGGWKAGSQANPPVMYLLKNGYALASIQYRFSSEATWPAQAYDCKAAIRFLRANAAKYNFDPDHFGVGGDSAGGHLAAFIGTSGDATNMEGDLGNPGVSSRVQAALDWFGPIDFLTIDEQNHADGDTYDTNSTPVSQLFGGTVKEKKDLAISANPITYIDKDCPPFLIMQGDNDKLVAWEQSVELAKALIDAGDEVTLKTLHGARHEDPQFRTPESQRLITDFLNQHLKPIE